MFIRKDTQKRCNPYAPYTDEQGTRYNQMPAELYEEIADTAPPADYSDDFYYRTEQDDAPYVVYTRKSDEQIQQVMLKKFISAMESKYDAVAQEKHYDNRYTCALRAGYSGPFQAEGQSFASWMDACNAYGYQEMAKVIGGTRPMPTVEELLSELPATPW